MDNEEIEKYMESLPEYMTPNDLVAFKIYSSTSEAKMERDLGLGPRYIKLRAKKILYEKSDLIAWLMKNEKTENFSFKRFCLQCKRSLDLERFYENKKSPCKECHVLIVKRWQKKHLKNEPR